MDKNTLIQTHLRNNKVAWAISDWTNETPDAISEDLMAQMDPSGILPKDVLYRSLFSGMNDFGSREEDGFIREEYLEKSIKCLDVKTYKANPYYRNIKLPKVSKGDWEFTRLEYKPYEAFISDDILFEPDTLKEIPQMGFFPEGFSYPAVLQKGREWMAIKPSEIESMQPAIDLVKGKVITFGLGLGYFAYMVSRKTDVTSVTIVERDENVISLFREYILPQFAHAKKIEIIQSDAFDYMQSVLPEKDFDYAFIDLWHDTQDGLSLYIKSKSFEKLSPRTKYLYWVEESLLSAYRWNIFDEIIETGSIPEILNRLGSKKLADDLSR